VNHLHTADIGGIRVAYYEQGSGPALVLLHGMFGDHLDWEPVLEPLARDFRVIAVDLPGFGESDKPDIDYTVEFFLDSLQALLKHLGIAKAALIGNSFGGTLSIFFAIAHPEIVERLVLVSSGGIRPFTTEEQARVAVHYVEENLGALTPAIQEAMLSPIFARLSDQRERYLAKQNAKLTRPDFKSYVRVLARCAKLGASHELVHRLAEIPCQTLMVWGDKDVVFPKEFAQKALPNLHSGKLVLLPDCGHVPQLDDPVAFVREVREFLTNGKVRSAPTY
jgi:2-hydroxy-6-oxonona-2,4-dienedioate hydrolase